MAIFGPKPWVNPFGKMSIFRLFGHHVFLAQKGIFSFQNIFLDFMFLQPRKVFFRSRIPKKTFSFPILPKKKMFEKWPFLDQNHGLTPLEKCPFFDFLDFMFFQPRKVFFRCRISFWTSCFYSLERCFFVLEYHKRHFPGLYCLKKKSWKNGHFWTKTMG